MEVLRYVIGIDLDNAHINRIQVNGFKRHGQFSGVGEDNAFTRNSYRRQSVLKKYITSKCLADLLMRYILDAFIYECREIAFQAFRGKYFHRATFNGVCRVLDVFDPYQAF